MLLEIMSAFADQLPIGTWSSQLPDQWLIDTRRKILSVAPQLEHEGMLSVQEPVS